MDKAQLEIKLATAVKDYKKNAFCIYISNKKRSKENLYPLLHSEWNKMTKDVEKPEALNAFSASVFNSNISCSPGT